MSEQPSLPNTEDTSIALSADTPADKIGKPRNGKPYFWVTHVVGLIAGEKHCEWAAWFKGHFTYTKRAQENASQLSQWQAEHGQAVRDARAKLEADGYMVKVEDQNKFTFYGHAANIGMKMDVIAGKEITVDDNRKLVQVRIVDCKTGKPKDADYWQMVCYVVTYARQTKLKNYTVVGEIWYSEGEPRLVTLAEATERFKTFGQYVRAAAGEQEPKRTPSAFECAFCDIAGCPERQERDDTARVDGDEF